MSILLDAGPALNFLAVGQQNALLETAQQAKLQLSAPERVDIEVRRQVKQPRFRSTAAAGTWTKLISAGHLEVLTDDLNVAAFTQAVTRVSGVPANQRVKQTASLGEIMVIAHASMQAQLGAPVFVLIDEGDGRRRAKGEARWLTRQPSVHGSLVLWDTKRVLQHAASAGWLLGQKSWEQVFNEMCGFDDGLTRLPK